MRYRIVIFFAGCFLWAVILTGCVRENREGKHEKVPYAVCKKNVIPKELMKLIEEEKQEAFHFTYSTKEYTYYVVGYGKQPGRHYKIKVKEFAIDKTHVYIDTTLIGVTKEEQKKGTSYPYLVLKSQFYEKDTVFR